MERLLPNDDDGAGEALLELTREIAAKELAPQVHEAEERAEFPEAAYRLLGRSGLLSLPFPEEYGGGAQPYETYLQVVEEIATAWPSVGVGVSVHCLTANVVATNGGDDLAHGVAAEDARAATGSAPTACPSRRPAPTSAASAPARYATATRTS